jgi:hypothetical protein
LTGQQRLSVGNNLAYRKELAMAIVKGVFVCPACGAGMNTDDQKRPDKCPKCSYKFNTVRATAFRLPKTFFQQYREITRARIEAIPPMPVSEDTAEVGAPDAHARYMEGAKAAIQVNATQELLDFIMDIPNEYIQDMADTFEFIIEMMACMSPSVQRHVTAKINRMYKIAANIAEGNVLGVRYGVKQAEPVPSTSPGIDPGTRGVPPTAGSS